MFPQGQKKKKKMDWRKKVSMQLMPIVCPVQVCSMKTTTVKIGFDAKKPEVGAHSLYKIFRNGPVCACVCVCVCVCVWRG